VQHLSQSSAQSLISWLLLSGVSTEISGDSCTWLKTEDLPVTGAAFSESAPAKAPADTVPVPGFSSFENLAAFNAYVSEWKDIGLCKTATHTVLGEGILQPRLMIIADAPDAEEDKSGKAFEGINHRMIRQAVGFAGFDPASLYMTYLSKWRPPGQRSLSATELRPLAGMLTEEIRLVQPQAVLVLGDSVFKALCSENGSFSGQLNKEIKIKKEGLNYHLPLFASQKGEFLVKNPTMKKSFWFGLLKFAATNRAIN
jgi:DNA polymerase